MKKDARARVSNKEMVGFVKNTLELESPYGKKISKIPKAVANYIDALPRVDRPRFINVLILSGGLMNTLLPEMSESVESEKYCDSLKGWKESTFGHLNDCVAKGLSSEDAVERMCHFLHDDTGHEDRIAILGAILISDLLPYGGMSSEEMKESVAILLNLTGNDGCSPLLETTVTISTPMGDMVQIMESEDGCFDCTGDCLDVGKRKIDD